MGIVEGAIPFLQENPSSRTEPHPPNKLGSWLKAFVKQATTHRRSLVRLKPFQLLAFTPNGNLVEHISSGTGRAARLFYPLINEGFKILEEGYVARSNDIDIVCARRSVEVRTVGRPGQSFRWSGRPLEAKANDSPCHGQAIFGNSFSRRTSLRQTRTLSLDGQLPGALRWRIPSALRLQGISMAMASPLPRVGRCSLLRTMRLGFSLDEGGSGRIGFGG